MPRSDKYVRIDKNKLYHVMALLITSGNNNITVKKARLTAIIDLLDLKLDEQRIDDEIKLLLNGQAKHGE